MAAFQRDKAVHAGPGYALLFIFISLGLRERRGAPESRGPSKAERLASARATGWYWLLVDSL
jgi:hypothetical protein